MKVGMISLGCTKNLVDSETALGLFKEAGYTFTEDPAQADILMVNTCGFINPAKEESIDTILEMAQYKQTGRCRLLVVTGCLAQRYEKDLLQEIPEIDLMLGVNQYDQLIPAVERALRGQGRECLCGEKYTFLEHERVLTTPAYTAYTRIGDGCSNRCTYCAIPLIRGPYRSRPLADVLGEVRHFAEQGVKEHILIAQDTTRYGTDWQEASMLPELMDQAARIPGVEWLRVLYAYPDEADDRLLEVLEEVPRVREDFGYPPLVTPTSQIVGTQAVMNVLYGERYKMVPKESKGLLRGEYGKLPAPVNEAVRKQCIGDDKVITCRFADTLPPELDKLREEMREWYQCEEDVLTYAMFPKVAPKYFEYRQAQQMKIDSGMLDKADKTMPV